MTHLEQLLEQRIDAGHDLECWASQQPDWKD